MWRLTYFIPFWLLMLVIRWPLALLGLVVVPSALYIREKSRGIMFMSNFPIWGNKQDREKVNDWYWSGKGNSFKARFWWYAIRNPIHNLGLALAIRIQPAEVRYLGDHTEAFGIRTARSLGHSVGFLAWQGAFSGAWYIRPLTSTRHFRIRIGWKITPDDVDGVEGERAKWGASFGFQLMPWRKG